MPLFPEINTYYKGRTHTQLVVSEGVAPAEKWIPSATEDVKFQYAFGPETNQNVVIPKGKIVTLAGMEWDYETEHNVPALKVANDQDDYVIGVNHHNVYERRRDRFGGNAPTVITREYIELPLFNDQAAAAAIKFGAAWNNDPTSMLNKFVKADEYGNFQVADPASDRYTKVIGQVLAIETDVPPAGFLQYFLEMTDNEFSEFTRKQSYAPSPGKAPDQDKYDSGTYPLGTSYLEPANRIRDWNKGIPRLTDGYFRARTEVEGITLDNVDVDTLDPTDLSLGDDYASTDAQFEQVKSFKVSGQVTINDGVVSVGADPRGAALYIRLKDTLVQDALEGGKNPGDFPEFSGGNPSDVKVFLHTTSGTEITKTQLSPNDVHVDYTNNMIVVYFTQEVQAAKLSLDATMLINSTPGIPTGWDWKGAVGAVRVLLQR